MSESPRVNMSVARAARFAVPVVVGTIDFPPVTAAGLRSVLGSYADRVRLHPAREDADVLLLDAASRCGAPHLPEGSAPVVVLVREGDLVASRAVKQAGGIPLPVTAAPAVLVQTLQSAHLAARSPHRHRHGLHAVRDAPGDGTVAATEPVTALSNREEEVLRGICAGLSNDDIAAELYVSINSIKTYIRSAYRKMGVTRRGQAVVWGMQRGYGEPVG